MGFWKDEEMLKTQAKIAKNRECFESQCKRVGLEEDTGEDPAKVTEEV